MKTRNFYAAIIAIILPVVAMFGQKAPITKVEAKPVKQEIRIVEETQELGTAMPVKNGKGAVTHYQIAVSNDQYEKIKKRNAGSKEPLKLGSPTVISAGKRAIGYTFTIDVAAFDRFNKVLGPFTIWVPRIDPRVFMAELFWRKWAVSPGAPGSVTNTTSRAQTKATAKTAAVSYTYGISGARQTASAVCGKISGTDTVFVIGGGVPLVRTYNATASSLSSTDTLLTTPVDEAGLIGDGNGALLFGGRNASGFSDKIYRYNTGFSQVPGAIPATTSYAGARAAVAAVTASNGKIYLFGGYNAGNNVMKDVLEFDGTTLAFLAQKADMPQGLRNATAIARGQYIYLFGGETASPLSGNLNHTVYRFDPAANTWKTIGADPAQYLMTFALDANGDINAIYPVADPPTWNGYNAADVTSSKMAETNSGSVTTINWTPSQNSFSNSPLPTGHPRYNFVTSTCNGNIYLIGGVNGRGGYASYANYENEVDIYAP